MARDRDRDLHASHGLHSRRRPRRWPARAHPLDPLRIRDAGDGRFASRSQLLRYPHQAEDRLGDGHIGWHRRNRRLQPDRRLRARARSPRAPTSAVWIHRHRRRGPRFVQPPRRRAGVASDRRPHERRLRPRGSLLPDRSRRHHGGDHPLHRARWRDPRPLPDRPASPHGCAGGHERAAVETGASS